MGLKKPFEGAYIEKTKICPYAKNHAKEDYLFRQKEIFCNIEKCPYNNQIEPEFMVEKLPKICKTRGLVEKLKE